ncbi:MAG: hypothetical protein AAFV93_03590 [Chloroflexota bacterium]
MSQKVTVTEHLQGTSETMRLEDVLEIIDTLHTIASDGDLPDVATMDEANMMNVLRDIIYTAQETIVELESIRAIKHRNRQHKQPILHIVPKVEEKVG